MSYATLTWFPRAWGPAVPRSSLQYTKVSPFPPRLLLLQWGIALWIRKLVSPRDHSVTSGSALCHDPEVQFYPPRNSILKHVTRGMPANLGNHEGSRSALILYGSETGNAQDVAEELGRLTERLHFLTRVSDLNSVEIVRIILNMYWWWLSYVRCIVCSFPIHSCPIHHLNNWTRRPTSKCSNFLEKPASPTPAKKLYAWSWIYYVRPRR